MTGMFVSQISADMMINISQEIDKLIVRNLKMVEGMVPSEDLCLIYLQTVVTTQFAFLGFLAANADSRKDAQKGVNLYIHDIPAILREGADRAIEMGREARRQTGLPV